ncbi:ATP-binding protein [Oceanobacter kriegii]|uniref:ATP-binding protein n=1 Tax=Oceanobacter kriegii TaxID=64972 RepID=UPI002481857B|nr:ATP-binding protein [Oceanobacter kriegii]
MFDPFVRGDKSRTRETGGHGLGLAIVKQILERHQGSVHIEDSPLGGARFVMRWPAQR